MDITLTFRHMEPTESLRLYAQEKLSKIKRYLDSPLEAHVVLEVEKFRHIADVTLNVDGTRIKGVEETGEEAVVQTPDEAAIVVEKLTSKPMDPEEAAMQLNISQQDFLVFRNSRTKEMNVIYKRRDGHLGLIEPSN
jgi:putative sigma-54 modulation protein